MKRHKNNRLSGRGAAGRPGEAKALENIISLAKAGDWLGVESAASRMLAASPNHPMALGFLGQSLSVLGKHKEGIGYLDAALQQLPGNLIFRGVRALAWVQSGDSALARDEAEMILTEDPQSLVALKVLGMCAHESKQYDEAEKYFMQAVELAPHDPESLNLLGKLLVQTEREEEAKPWIKRSIKLNPRSATPFYLLGSSYRHLCRFRTAYSYYRYAHHLDPDAQATNVNLGVGLMDIGRVHEAIEILRDYVGKYPDAADAHYNLSNALLLLGQLEDGWREYEWRKKTHLVDRQLPFPHWQGEPLTGKTLLITAEQGVGDEIWAASMFGEVIEGAGHVIIECEPRLASLFQRSFPQATITPKQAGKILLPADHKIDYQCAMMSLARYLRNHESKFPGKVGYLIPDEVRREFWRWRLNKIGNGLKVGIAWRSGMLKGTRRASYSSLDEWSEIFSIPGVTFVNLQYGDCQAELDAAESAFGIKLHNFRDIDLKDNFEDVAALMSELDVVVTPAISVGAIGGALNVPILQFVPHNHWSCFGKDYDPLYPSKRLYFRPWNRDWSEAIHGIAMELVRRVQLKSAQSGLSSGEEQSSRALQYRIGRGSILLGSGFHDKARTIFEEIVTLMPDHAEATMWLGVCHRIEGNRLEAEACLRRAVALDPLSSDALNQLGVLLLEKQFFDEARQTFLHCLDLRPGYPDALCNLGNAYLGLSKAEEAEQAYRRVIAILGGHSIARYNLAILLEDKGDASSALMEYQTVIDAKPNYAEAWSNLGRLYGKLGRRNEAIAAYRKALAINPRFNLAKNNLAKNLLTDGEYAEAARLLKELANEMPPDAKLANNLGAALAMQGDTEAAIMEFERAIEINPSYMDAYKNLAQILQVAGRLEEAKAVLQMAVSKFAP